MQLLVILLVVNACLAWFMTGLIWFVQIVHYPMFDMASRNEFVQFANRHCQLTTSVVALPMVAELLCSFLLAVLWNGNGKLLVWLCFLLVVGIWFCTVAYSIPSHNKFCSVGFVQETHHYLVTTNWVRTILWTVRAGLLAVLLSRLRFN